MRSDPASSSDATMAGLRKGNSVFEITTYRSEQYRAESRKPDVRYGRWLEEDLAGGTSPSTRWRPGCPATSSLICSAASTR